MPHTIEGVEICTVGMNWPASTGDVTITFENIADAITAANEDPHIQVPRGRLGHTSALNGDVPRWEPFAAIGDAEPAFGRFVNLRATNDGAVLVGDAVDVPDWINASSYPNRSMESIGHVQMTGADSDVTTPGGKRYSMVITAVSWLGIYFPAVQDLADLTALMTGGPAALAASREETPMPTPVAASVSTTTVRERFNFDWAISDPVEGLDTYWWWARDVRVDPDEIIADDDEGGLWSIPYTTDGEDAVTFGAPVRVRETYLPVAASAASEDTAPEGQRILATFTRPKKDNPAAASAGAPTHEEETITMDDNVRQVLIAQGHDPDTATEDQINAVNVGIAAGLLTPDPVAPDPDADTPETPAAAAETDTDPIDAERDRQLVEATARIASLEAERIEREATETNTRRDALASDWVSEGRITPAERDHYRGLLDIDEPRTVALAATLTPGRVPVTKTPSTASAASGDRTTTGWFPSLKED